MATRTWVSGVGDDANPCSRTAPCKTFAGAISKTAAGGEISVLDPGGFGAVTITKGMTIDGSEGAGFGSILASFTNGVVINAGANDVVALRNLSINGAGSGLIGIRILAARAVFIENCEIFGFGATSSLDVGVGIRDFRAGPAQLFITGCTVRNNFRSGIVLLPSSGTVGVIATIDNCWLQGNGNAGLAAATGTRVMVSNTIATGNTNFGIAVEAGAGTTQVNIEHCVMAHNGTGLSTSNGAPTTRLSNSTIVNNNVGIALSGGTVFSYVNNRIEGNGSGNAPSPGQTIPLR